MVTQYVVGAAGEPDTELLTTTQMLYREVNLRRAHYSAFSPIPGTPLDEHAATSPRREHRLYQADFLMRQYGFAAEELVYRSDGNLPAGGDPKLIWARFHPERYPIEVNTASRADLLRIPGIGPQTVERILTMRRVHHLLQQRRRPEGSGRCRRPCLPFVLLNGRRPAPICLRRSRSMRTRSSRWRLQLELPLWQQPGCDVK